MTKGDIGAATLAAHLLTDASSGVTRARDLLDLAAWDDPETRRRLSSCSEVLGWIRMRVDATLDLARATALGDAMGELRARAELEQITEGLDLAVGDAELRS